MIAKFIKKFFESDLTIIEESQFEIRMSIFVFNIMLIAIPILLVVNLLYAPIAWLLIFSDAAQIVLIFWARSWTIRYQKPTLMYILILGWMVVTGTSFFYNQTLFSSTLVYLIVSVVMSSLFLPPRKFAFVFGGQLLFFFGLIWIEMHGVMSMEASAILIEMVKVLFNLILVVGVIFYLKRVINLAFLSNRQMEEEKQQHENEMLIMTERERMGQQLHDGLGQILGYISLEASSAKALLHEGYSPLLEELLSKISTAAAEGSVEVRHHILNLQETEKVDLPDRTLTESLRGYCTQFEARYGLKVNISLPENEESLSLPPNVELSLIKVIQEAMVNAAKHSQTNQILVTFQEISDLLQIIISDSGIGFESADDASDQHFGIRMMRKRIEQIGGNFEIRSTIGRGTTIVVTVPFTKSGTDRASVLRGKRALLVDDHPLFLDGLRTAMTISGVEVVGTATDGQSAVIKALEQKPDFIIMDLHLPVLNGILAMERIKEKLPSTHVVIMTASQEDEHLYKAINSGASGFLYKDLSSNQLLDLLIELSNSSSPLSPAAKNKLISMFRRTAQPIDAVAQGSMLTTQQNRIIALLGKGMTYEEIGTQLNLSTATVKYHMKHIYQILGVKSRSEVITKLRDNSKPSGA